jgi:signal transduction histidine kinase
MSSDSQGPPDAERILALLLHELRAPVIGIRANADMLRRRFTELPHDRAVQTIDNIDASARIVLTVLKEVEWMAFAGRRRVDRKDLFNLFEPFAQAKLDVSLLLRERGLSPNSIVIGPELRRFKVRADQGALRLAAACLFGNSIKFAAPADDPDQFRVEVEAHHRGDDIHIRVRDWGIGFAEGFEEKAFEAGARGSQSFERSVHGFGFGLTLVRRIMAEHQGSAQVTSRIHPTEITLTMRSS